MEEERNEELDKLEIIEKSGGIELDKIHCISIIGQIEGHYTLPSEQKSTKYEHIVPLLVSIEQSKEIEGLLIILNTMGGDVEAGLAIAELIASMKKPTVSLVLGGGHSIGVPLAVSAKKSFIVPSATMTIHPVRISGTVVGSPQTYYYFERMQSRIVSFVCGHSKISEEKLTSLMMATDQIATDTGSVIDGEEAVSCGLIDAVGGLSDALECLNGMIKENQSPSQRG
ncbi:MAG: peptidase S14 [Ruminococcaceae bacterium]|nr:peptidase S14 [Oscillospiraceae bacterium]